jgi:hypothetical protein
MSGENSDGTNDPTASGTEPPWPDPTKSSWGYQPPMSGPTYQAPYQHPGYEYPTEVNQPPRGNMSTGRSGISVWWIVGGGALLAIVACGFGVLIARLLWG